MSFVLLLASLRSLHAGVYRISLTKCLGAYFKFQQKNGRLLEGGGLIEASAYYAFLDVTFQGNLRRLPRVRQWGKH